MNTATFSSLDVRAATLIRADYAKLSRSRKTKRYIVANYRAQVHTADDGQMYVPFGDVLLSTDSLDAAKKCASAHNNGPGACCVIIDTKAA